MSVFKRSYLLTLSSIIRTPPDPRRPYNLSVEEGFEGVPRSIEDFEVTELRVSGKVFDTLNNSNNKNTQIELFNATPAILAKLKKPNVYMTLAAGYELDSEKPYSVAPQDLPVIFTGEVVNMNTEKDGPDFITTISAKDSEISFRDSYISERFPAKTKIEDILTKIVTRHLDRVTVGRLELGEVKLPKGVSGPLLLPKQRLNNDYTAYGRVVNVLKELADDFGFIWYITGNKFYAQPPEYKRARKTVKITPDKVLGDILPSSGTNNLPNGAKVAAGVSFKVFLDGRLDTSSYISVSGFTEDKNGDYKIIELVHVFDTRGQDWYTEIIAEGV